MEYTPNKWKLIKITGGEFSPLYKVVGGWFGGYIDGDSWRVNSGIERYWEDDEYYYFHGFSGSIYKCKKSSEGFIMIMQGAINQFLDYAATIEGMAVEIVDVEELCSNLKSE